MGNCLVIGNGINRCLGGMSWEKLLTEIASRYFTSADTVASSTLAFEQLKCAVLSRNWNVSADDFAFDILKELDSLPQDEYNQLFNHYLQLNLDTILTTNFDYSIEKSLIEDFQYEKYTANIVTPQERKCSRIRHIKIGDKRIFHIHGELGKKATLCLGNVHYAENLSIIMKYMLDYSKDNDSYSLKESVFAEDLISWAQFFFKDNIYMVGLGLYECDMDLWWLLSYRRQLSLEGDKRIKNKIIYYYLYEDKKDQNFKDCLSAMGVEVREQIVKNGGWKEAYINIAKDIETIMEA
ncbi:MAG: SIR2 family protein [Clostridia bacterium]|nr:SIR2 family protein [Clostridia bacterium]